MGWARGNSVKMAKNYFLGKIPDFCLNRICLWLGFFLKGKNINGSDSHYKNKIILIWLHNWHGVKALAKSTCMFVNVLEWKKYLFFCPAGGWVLNKLKCDISVKFLEVHCKYRFQQLKSNNGLFLRWKLPFPKVECPLFNSTQFAFDI